ncbi:hypothetical protein TeGR_g4998 [Tetraparma gracilis]|uniref:Uncharacterized protein n=1 Tax=Tetraparma gracilis TaxID=2962635 RepID=A0ABQ6M6E8_9STRA|nr:hypothetical protein TeGR_g4998 [Tetraparma gracilis]
MGNLANLLDMNLGNNMLTGPIPESFGHLRKLQLLDLSYNVLDGSLPDVLGQLEDLHFLALGNNALSGEMPRSVCDLADLTTLSLSDNFIGGSIPRCLYKLDKLGFLDLAFNKLEPPFPDKLRDRCLGTFIHCFFSSNPVEGYLCEDYHATTKGVYDEELAADYGTWSNSHYATWSTARGAVSEGRYRAFAGSAAFHACLPCANCLSNFTCDNSFVRTPEFPLCDTCPIERFEVTGRCLECPKSALASFVLPLSVLLSIALLTSIVFLLSKRGVVTLPSFRLDVNNIIRIKQLCAAVQAIFVFMQLSNSLAPWFVAMTSILAVAVAPFEIQPVCYSWYQNLRNSHFFFLSAVVALFTLFSFAFALRRAHKMAFLRARLSPHAFANFQKLSALIVVQAPIAVLPFAISPEKSFVALDNSPAIFVIGQCTLAVLVYILHRVIKTTSSRFKSMRAKIIDEFASMSAADLEEALEVSWDDIDNERPFIATFSLQYTPAEFQHEERAIWRKIMWLLGTGVVRGVSLKVTMDVSGTPAIKHVPSLMVITTNTLFIVVNLVYARHLLRRPYASHRRSRKLGDPMNDAELLITRATSWGACLLTFREAVISSNNWPSWSMDVFCVIFLVAVVYSQLPLFSGFAADARTAISRGLSRHASSGNSSSGDFDRSRLHSGVQDFSGGHIEKMLQSESFREVLLQQSRLKLHMMSSEEKRRWITPEDDRHLDAKNPLVPSLLKKALQNAKELVDRSRWIKLAVYILSGFCISPMVFQGFFGEYEAEEQPLVILSQLGTFSVAALLCGMCNRDLRGGKTVCGTVTVGGWAARLLRWLRFALTTLKFIWSFLIFVTAVYACIFLGSLWAWLWWCLVWVPAILCIFLEAVAWREKRRIVREDRDEADDGGSGESAVSEGGAARKKRGGNLKRSSTPFIEWIAKKPVKNANFSGEEGVQISKRDSTAAVL